ncbi:MAG: hypothetical protein V3T09_00135 [bacterium]
MIKELKKEHSVIIDTLNKIMKLGIRSKEGKDLALSAKESILNHIKKEDKKIYHALRKAAKSNQKLEETLDLFKQMDAISNAAIDFFHSYTTKGRHQLTIGIEWLIETLTWRIQREEQFLFRMYENLN